uniref:Uncharacterized protein n=1 Tax=Glossina austeni TaxID=7395 RepID=A0A1A9VL85_GLOAU
MVCKIVDGCRCCRTTTAPETAADDGRDMTTDVCFGLFVDDVPIVAAIAAIVVVESLVVLFASAVAVGKAGAVVIDKVIGLAVDMENLVVAAADGEENAPDCVTALK